MERCSRRSRFGEKLQNEVPNGSVHFQVVKTCIQASFFMNFRKNARGTDKKVTYLSNEIIYFSQVRPVAGTKKEKLQPPDSACKEIELFLDTS